MIFNQLFGSFFYVYKTGFKYPIDEISDFLKDYMKLLNFYNSKMKYIHNKNEKNTLLIKRIYFSH